MLRLFASVFIIILILIFVLSYGSSFFKKYVGGGKDSLSIIEINSKLKDIKDMNAERKKTIKENEKMMEDFDENY